MKTKILFLLLLTSLGTFAQNGLSEKETNNINTLINSTIQVNADTIKSNDLNKANAIIFQDALDALFPLDYFDYKVKTNYQKDNIWLFVRSESFSKKKGFKIFTNANDKVIGINAEQKLNN